MSTCPLCCAASELRRRALLPYSRRHPVEPWLSGPECGSLGDDASGRKTDDNVPASNRPVCLDAMAELAREWALEVVDRLNANQAKV